MPYPGLKVFGLEDAAVFYGRARALAAVKESLQTQAGRNYAFLLIFGMSGSGKSSLVRAGLLHALTATPGWIEGVDVWRWCLVRPGDATGDPLDALAQAFFGDTALPELRAGGIDATRLGRTLRDNPDDIDLVLRPALRAVADSERQRRAADRPLEARLLVVVDQMEELFARDRLDEPGRVRYVAALGALARSGAAWVVATMRSEFFARCAEIPELAALKAGQGQLDLLPPNFAEIGQMIRYPARDAAWRWGKDPDHPGQALDDVLQEAAWRDPKALPLLQFTLNELFRRREGRALTCEAYRALGGLEGALANHAEATLAALPPEVQAALPSLFRTLVTAGEGEQEPVVSRRVPLAALRDDPIRGRLLDVLIDARLLVTDRDDRMQPVVGIAHEALLTHWPRLKDLVDKDREFLRARSRITTAAERWRRESRDVDFLLPEGKPLAEARDLLKTRRSDLDPETIEFIEHSIRYRTRQRRRRTRAIATIAGVVLSVVSAFAVFSFVEWRDALFQKKVADGANAARLNEAVKRLVAEEQRHDAELKNTQQKAARDLAEGRLVAQEAGVARAEHFHQKEALDLARSLTISDQSDIREQWLTAIQRALVPVATSPRRFMVGRLAYSPDKRYLVTSEFFSGSIRVWRTQGWVQERVLSGHPVPKDASPLPIVTALAFCPDRPSELISTGQDGTVRVWDVLTGAELRRSVSDASTPAPVLWSLSVSPIFDSNGMRNIITGDAKGKLAFWDLDSLRKLREVQGNAGDLLSVRYSPSGKECAGAAGRLLRLWDSGGNSTGDLATPGIKPDDEKFSITDLAYSPDGSQIACGASNGRIYIWDVAKRKLLHEMVGNESGLPGVRGIVSKLAYAAPRKLFTGGGDGAIKEWDTATGNLAATRGQHAANVVGVRVIRSLAVSPDGQELATTG
ncbi:MAG TPA: WD40 repeat domain-containing protein, partial [Isosphaeraceae bacterium]|nr:WD40 repeat domain-containing protein [Isosphaeraceae bacterium]